MAYENDILTRNDNDELAVRTVQSVGDNPASSYDDVYTRDNNGKLAVRVVGSGGGDSHNKGYFATQAALEEAYPTGEAGDYAIVGSTDTVWIWDDDNSEWVDTDTKGEVVSVNGKTGTVVLNADDVGAVPQYSSMPEPNQAGDIVQYTGTTNQNYTNGYFYKSGVSGTEIVDGNCTITSYENGEGQDPGSQYYPTFIFDKSVFDAYLVSQSATANTGTSIIFDLATDDDTGDNLLVAHYNTNDSVSTMLIDVEGEGLNQTYAILGFTTNFADPEEDPETADQQLIFVDAGHITVSLPTENTYGWERIDVQPMPVIPDPLPSQTGNSGKFLITNGTVASWGTTVEDNTLVIKNSQSSMYGGYPNQITFYSKYNGSDGTGASIQSGNNGSLVLSASSIATTGAIYPSGSVNLGLDTQSGAWNTVYARNLGNRSSSYVIQIPEATAGGLAVQVSTMPTADSTRVGQIYQYIGATDANYTHGYFYECVSDGGNPVTYSWSAINVQAGGGGGGSTATTALLDEMGWSNNSQTVNVTGVTASNNVIVAPAPASQANYTAAGIICTAQGAGTLTFTCQTTPSSNLTVNVLILG